jgi:hypothetical protein
MIVVLMGPKDIAQRVSSHVGRSNLLVVFGYA